MNTEHQLKSKLTWPKCPKSMRLKQKWNRSNDYNCGFLNAVFVEL